MFTVVEYACQLLGCSTETLAGSLMQRTVAAGGDIVKTDLTVAGVSHAVGVAMLYIHDKPSSFSLSTSFI